MGCIELRMHKVEATDRLRLFGFILLSTVPKASDSQLCCATKEDREKWVKKIEVYAVPYDVRTMAVRVAL